MVLSAAPAIAQTTPALAVVRVGDGSAALSGAATPAFVDFVGVSKPSIALPIAEGANGAAPLTMAGNATSEGFLRLSGNGACLTLTGYGTAPGTAAVATSTSAAVNRVIGIISNTGVVDTTTRSTTLYSGGNIRGAASDDCNEFWTTGTASTNGGMELVSPRGAGNAATMLAPTPTNVRVPGRFGGQIYETSASGVFVGLNLVTPGSPGTTTLLPGFPGAAGPSPYGFVLFDLNPAVAGLDVAYVADDRAAASGGGVQKWTFDGTTWTLAATFVPPASTVGARGLTGRIVGGNAQLFFTSAETSANSVVTFTDDGSVAPTFTVLATAAANTVFRGIDFAPAAPAASVPAVPPFGTTALAVLLVAVALLALGAARRRA
jgi:hypothetical protein